MRGGSGSRPSVPRAAVNVRRIAVVAGLLALGLGLQLHFFAAYPRPVLFGDPAGYYKVGVRLLEALGRWRGGEPLAAAYESVRGTFYLLGVGSVFALLEAWRPQDWGFFQRAFGLFNTAAMLGVFLLGRRLSGRFAGGVAGLAVAAVYPTFSVQTGRLYPDPLTGCLFVWAAWLYAEALGREERGARWMAAAALVFSVALAIRSQLIAYMLLVVPLALLLTARAWVRRPQGRRLALALALALLPLFAFWVFVEKSVGGRDDVTQLGNVTFNPPYPFGFWQSLETDGWVGPYRSKTEPYFLALQEAGRSDPQLMRSRARQWAFTARYVGARWRQSSLLVLDNAYRLYDRPANDYKWDYPFPYPWQVALQRVVIVLGVAGAALFVAESPGLAAVFLLPASLALLHGLVFPWPRYNVPAMPILLAAAGAAAVRLAPVRPRGGAARALAAGVLLLGLAWALSDVGPAAARLLAWAGTCALLAAPFLLIPRAVAHRRAVWAAAAGALALLVPFTAHALRSRLWHERWTTLGPGGVAGVEQEIALPPEARAALRAADEVFLVLDLRVPQGDLGRVALRVGPQDLPGGALQPTMPRLRESTSTGGRDWRGYPQWWALRVDPAWLPAEGQPLRVRLTYDGAAPLRLGGDRFADQERVYEGPSFGDWPHAVALKLEYDGDYRIPVTLPLGSQGTRSSVIDARGRRPLARVHRIRLVTLRNNAGWLAWRSAPLPPGGSAALAFSAWSGQRGTATLALGGGARLELPLGAGADFRLEQDGLTLCHRYEGERGEKAYGSYALIGPVARLGPPGAPLDLQLRFTTGMSDQPLFFVIDRQRAPAATAAALGPCLAPGTPVLPGAAQVVDATHNNYPEDTGRWAVAAVY
jgi:hypothetical protein